MTALTADRHGTYFRNIEITTPTKVYQVAVDEIFVGAAVSINAAGFLVPQTDTAGEVFAGIANENVDNSTGSAGDLSCEVRLRGEVLLALGTAVQTDVGATAMCEDDQTTDRAATSTNDIPMGMISEIESGSSVWVLFDAVGASR